MGGIFLFLLERPLLEEGVVFIFTCYQARCDSSVILSRQAMSLATT